MSKIKLIWTAGKRGLHVGHLTTFDGGEIPAEIATIKASEEGKAFLTRAVNLAAEQAAGGHLFKSDLYSRVEFEKGKR